MADDIDVTPGSGKTVGTYDRGGKQVQRVSTADKNLTVYEATVTASGNTTAITPSTAAKAIRVHYVYAMVDPAESTYPLIRIGFSDAAGTSIGTGKGKYRCFGIAKERVFEGAADERVIINLSATSSVAVTVHYEEFTP